jgi:hypothetical protein
MESTFPGKELPLKVLLPAMAAQERRTRMSSLEVFRHGHIVLYKARLNQSYELDSRTFDILP